MFRQLNEDGNAQPGGQPSAGASVPLREHARVVFTAMLAAAAYIYLLRRPTSITAPSFFAEDGTVFFKDAIERGWGVFFEGYSGQLWVFTRGVAAAAAPLPVSIQPAVYQLAAVCAAVLSCSFILSSRWRFEIPLSARFVCMLALLCSPAVDEAFGSLAYAHWWLGIGLVLIAMLKDPVGRRLKIGEVAFTALTATSGFAAIYAVPVLAVRAYRNRSRHSVSLLAVALAGILVQIGYLLASPRRGDPAALLDQPKTALLVLGKRLFAATAIGDANLPDLWPGRAPDLLVWPLMLALAVVITMALLRAPRLEALGLLMTFFGGWVLALWALTQPYVGLELLLWPTAASRFFLIPTAVIYLSLVLSWPRGFAQRAATGLACLLIATGILSDYHLSSQTPVDWAPFAACVERRTEACTTVIPPGWQLQVELMGR